MRFLTVREVLELHEKIIAQSGGDSGLRLQALLDASVEQCKQTFDGHDLYPTLHEKAASLCFSMVKNHPFVDGNKRIGHGAMELFLLLNGYELSATVDSAEEMIQKLAAGERSRNELSTWIQNHLCKRSDFESKSSFE